MGHQAEGAHLEKRIRRLDIDCLADARLADVVECRPGKVADDIIGGLHHRPANADLIGVILGTEDYSVRVELMALRILVFHVVVADDIKAVRKGLGKSLPARFIASRKVRVLDAAA